MIDKPYTEQDMRNAFTLGYIEGQVKHMGKVKLMNVSDEDKAKKRAELREHYKHNPLEIEYVT